MFLPFDIPQYFGHSNKFYLTIPRHIESWSNHVFSPIHQIQGKLNLDIERQLKSVVMNYVSPILVYNENKTDASQWVTGGTCFFVKSEEKSFLVTAGHVIEERDNSLKKNRVVTQIGGNGMPPVDISSWRVISNIEEIDICTLSIPDEFDITSIQKEYIDFSTFKKNKINKDDVVIIYGFPAFPRIGSMNHVESTPFLIQMVNPHL